jgi:uncharacterized membrane protein
MHFPIFRAAALFVSIILGGVLLFVFDFYELNSPGVNTGLLLLMTTLKMLYFLGATLHWIQQTVASAYHRRYLMGFLVLQVLLIVLSFAVDYYCLYQINSASFVLPADQLGQGLVAQLLTFLYFSLGKYTTAGGGEMHPGTPAAQVCAMGEMVVSYFTTVLIIANVGYLQTLFSRSALGAMPPLSPQEPSTPVAILEEKQRDSAAEA